MKRQTAASPDFFSAQVSQARRFYLNLRPPQGTKLAVVCGGVEHCAPDYEIRRQTFPFYSIEYVARGEGHLKLGRRRHELRPGTIFAYGPGVPQHITATAHKPLVKYFVDFAGTGSAAWIRHAGLAPGRVSQVYPPNEIQPLFDELIRNGQRGTRHALSSGLTAPHAVLCVDVRVKEQNYELLRRFDRDWREIAGYYLGDYYPLTSYSLDTDQWMAWQFDLPRRGEGCFWHFVDSPDPRERPAITSATGLGRGHCYRQLR